MVFGFLTKRVAKKVKLGGKKNGVVILDFTERTIKLPNGDVIRREDIINFDAQTRTLIYRGPGGELKTVRLVAGEGEEDKLLTKFFEKLHQGKESRGILYL